ncbi:MAG: VWA domain-containing protein [Candidatus Solibacter usitatus]|nr:VWA domain-containing protein [Candidatus Solibacter usitatus]
MTLRPWVALALCSFALAQNEQRPIRVQVNEVIVPVTVVDDQGKFVSNLDASDFHIFDEGKEQKINFFSRERSQPVVVGFLLDQSNGMRIHWKTYQDAAMELILNLLPGDKKFAGYLITYGNQAELQVNTASDSEKMVEKLRKLKPGGGSALYDAIYMACTTRELVKGEPYEPRRVLIVIGDGHDTASKKTLEEALEVAQRNLVTIYAMSTVSFGFNAEGDKNLIRLAEETGGRPVYPLNSLYKGVAGYLSTPSDEGNFAYKVGTGGYASAISSSIFRAIANVSGEITTQYILRYVPNYEEESKDGQRKFRSAKDITRRPCHSSW